MFMVYIGIVYVDVIAAMLQLLAVVFLVFLVVTMLSRDIFARVCYILIMPPVRRHDYYFGRFLGVSAAFLQLLLVILISASLAGWLYLSGKALLYQSGFSWYYLAQLIFFYYFQYISILGFIFFIVSWSSGDAETMVFTLGIMILSWVFPPVLKAMQNSDVAENTPEPIMMMLQWVYDALPHLQGSEITLRLSHGIALSIHESLYYVLEHSVFAWVFLLLGWRFFKRRDL